MISSYLFSILLASIAVIGFALYITIYIVLSWRVKRLEGELLDLFIKKTSKIPALIEVMRPYVDKSECNFLFMCHDFRKMNIFSIYEILLLIMKNVWRQILILFTVLYKNGINLFESKMGRLSDIFFLVNINKSYDSRFFLMILKYIKIPQIIRGIL